MSPIEHYFENLLDMGSDIKGEPNKNALSREVQEAVEICADYVKYDLLLGDTKANMIVIILEELLEEFEKLDPDYECNTYYAAIRDCSNLTQQKIDKLKENVNK